MGSNRPSVRGARESENHVGLRPVRRPPSGFTLLELLVVSLIIVILAAMLLPVLAAVRERARQTQCLNNLSQLGKAIIMYSENYREMMPDVLPPPGTSSAELHNGTEKSGLGKLYPSYNRDPRIFYCPSANYFTLRGPQGFSRWGSDSVVSSFFYRGTGDGSEPLVVTDKKAILMDYNQELLIGRYNHGGRFANILFGDGHVFGVGDPEQKSAQADAVEVWKWADLH